jgi:3-oxoacyl-[acyl-carrier protein] reductase
VTTLDLSRPARELAAGLAGKRTLVIGGHYGVGPAVVAALREAGAKLVVDHAGDQGAEVVTAADPIALIAAAAERLGGLDVLVVSAPPVRNKPVLDMTAAEMRGVVESELVVPALQMQAAAKIMAEAEGGRIIAFLSMSGKAGVHHGVAPYAAAKGGMLSFMRVLAAETAEHGVTVNGIATALFEPQTATMTPEKRDRLRTQIPVGRFGRSEEAAHAVLYLASPHAGFVTGECLNLSGGRFMD